MVSAQEEHIQLAHRTEPRLIAVCIPAFNEEGTIARVVIGSQQFANEVIVCDDGSTDLTGTIAERLGARVIRHEKKMGRDEALKSLLLASNQIDADVMVSINGDGESDASEIPHLVGPIVKGSADVVIGSRFLEVGESSPKHRRGGNGLFNVLAANEITDYSSGFRAYSRRAVQSILPIMEEREVDSEILTEALMTGLRVAETPVSADLNERKFTQSNRTLHAFLSLLTAILSTSFHRPIVSYGLLGSITLASGLILAFRFSLSLGQQGGDSLGYVAVVLGLVVAGLFAIFTGINLSALISTTKVRTE